MVRQAPDEPRLLLGGGIDMIEAFNKWSIDRVLHRQSKACNVKSGEMVVHAVGSVTKTQSNN